VDKSSKSQAVAAADFAARGEGAIAVPWLPIALFGRLPSNVGSLFSRVFGSFASDAPRSLAPIEQVRCSIPLLLWHSAAGVSVVATIERTA
jgi:hypothetical protein